MKRSYECSTNLDEEKKIMVENELKLGFLNLNEKYFDQAKLCFDIALQYDAQCPDAFWGEMLCKMKLDNEDLLYCNPMGNKTATSLLEWQNPLEYANENLRKKYDDLLERINKINEGDNF